MPLDKVLILDTHHAIWRSNFIFKQAHGEMNTDFVVVFNFFRSLKALVEDFEPHKIFAALEGHPQFRYDLYPGYKANRIIKKASASESQERFNTSLPIILRLLKHLPITTVRAAKYEADDTIAALVENIKDEDVTVVSGDTDYIQLLQKGYPSFRVYNPIKKVNMEAPSYPYVAWKSLTGDKSDSIQRLVSDKKATFYCTMPEELDKYLGASEENRANFAINRKLIEFAQVPDDELVMENGETNFDALKKEFTQMEFASMVVEPYWGRFCAAFNSVSF